MKYVGHLKLITAMEKNKESHPCYLFSSPHKQIHQPKCNSLYYLLEN